MSTFYIVTDNSRPCDILLRLGVWHCIPSEETHNFHLMNEYVWQYHNVQDPMFHVEHWALQYDF